MSKLKPRLFAVAITVATLIPTASASAGLTLANHDETLLKLVRFMNARTVCSH